MPKTEKPTATDMALLRKAAARPESEIETAAQSDEDNQPLSDDVMATMEWVEPGAKVPITIRIDASVLSAYKATGKGWQTRMHEALQAAQPFLAPAFSLAQAAALERYADVAEAGSSRGFGIDLLRGEINQSKDLAHHLRKYLVHGGPPFTAKELYFAAELSSALLEHSARWKDNPNALPEVRRSAQAEYIIGERIQSLASAIRQALRADGVPASS